MVTRYWRRETHSIQILNTIYESLFIVDTNFIDGNQYNTNVTDRDPINDTTFLTPYFILVGWYYNLEFIDNMKLKQAIIVRADLGLVL